MATTGSDLISAILTRPEKNIKGASQNTANQFFQAAANQSNRRSPSAAASFLGNFLGTREQGRVQQQGQQGREGLAQLSFGVNEIINSDMSQEEKLSNLSLVAKNFLPSFEDPRLFTAAMKLVTDAGTNVRGGGLGEAPSNVRSFQFFQKLNPQDQETFMALERSGKTIDLGDKIGILDQRGKVTQEFDKGLTPAQQPALKGQQVEAQETARVKVKLKSAMPKLRANVKKFKDNTSFIEKQIDRALKIITKSTSAGRVVGGKIVGTDAKALQGLIDTISARIGFDELSSMRSLSPTGGALGQVSERELTLLTSVLGSLDVGLPTDALIENFNDIKNQRNLSFQRLQESLNADVDFLAGLNQGQDLGNVTTTEDDFIAGLGL